MFSNIGETSQQCNCARQRCKTNVFLRNWLFDSFCQARLRLIVLKIDHRGLSPLSSITILKQISVHPKFWIKRTNQHCYHLNQKSYYYISNVVDLYYCLYFSANNLNYTWIITFYSSTSVEGADSGVKSRCIRWTTFWGPTFCFSSCRQKLRHGQSKMEH